MSEMKFGKYKGQDVAEVPTDYLEWAAQNMEGGGRNFCIKELKKRGITEYEEKKDSQETHMLKRIIAKLVNIEERLGIAEPRRKQEEEPEAPAVNKRLDFGSDLEEEGTPF